MPAVSLNIARELLRGCQHVCLHSTIDQFAAGTAAAPMVQT